MAIARTCVFDDLFKEFTHELTQPLMSILSNARAAQHLLRSRHLDRAEVQTILEDIASQDKRAADTLRQLRGMLEKSGALRQPLYLDDVLRDALILVRGAPVAASVEFRMKVAERLPPVLAQRSQIRDVLMTLLHNACEATRQGTNKQRMVDIRVDVDEGMSRVSVEGRGHGIGTEHLERMLQGFFVSAPHPLMLGLARCRLVLAAHEGYLWATDRPNEGVVFHFAIPICDGEVL